MKFNGSFFIVFSLVLSSGEIVGGFDFVREILFPRNPVVKRVRRINEEARSVDDDATVLDTVGLIEKHGYPAEEHNVTTEDGYNIIFFRIPGSPKSSLKDGKPVVFIQHGMLGSSDTWVLLGPTKDLVFLLADAGYDVWIGNVRGNSYGRSHTDLSPQDPQFWDFSYHEMGMWDLPKMIDYALGCAKQKRLFYIGHSMGTTTAYVLLSEKPEYNEKIRLFIALAPIAIWKGPPNPFIELITINGDAIKEIFDKNGIYEVGPQTANNVRLGRALCSDKSLTQPMCAAIFFLFAGHDPQQLNMSILAHVISHIPAGVSTKTLEHYRQNIISGTFQPYDSGYIANFKLYRKKRPPIYDIKKISAPVALIYGKNDVLAREKNTFELGNRLQNVVTVEPVPYDMFNHLDFMWAINAKKLLFCRIMELMAMHSM